MGWCKCCWVAETGVGCLQLVEEVVRVGEVVFTICRRLLATTGYMARR